MLWKENSHISMAMVIMAASDDNWSAAALLGSGQQWSQQLWTSFCLKISLVRLTGWLVPSAGHHVGVTNVRHQGGPT